MTDSALRQQISREVKRALHDAGLSAAGAARKMPDKPGAKLIYRWMRREVTAPLDRLSEFAEATGQPITLTLGPETQKEAPSDVPTRLDEILAYVRAIAGGVPVSAADRAAIEALHHGVAGTKRNGRPPGAPRPKANRRPPGT